MAITASLVKELREKTGAGIVKKLWKLVMVTSKNHLTG